MFPPIEEGWKEVKQASIKKFPQHFIRASSAGHPCHRYHWHSIKDWEKVPKHDVILQSIFDEGHLHETHTIRLLSEIGEVKGFEVVEQQRSYVFPKPKITGRIDGKILWKKKGIPFDVKTINPWDFQKLSSAEDFLYSKKVHQRNYIAQIQLYMLMSNSEYGMLILKDKQTGQIKVIMMQMDYAFCESILKRAEKVYQDLEKGEPGARTKDQTLCIKCPYAFICLPDLTSGKGIELLKDPDFESKLSRREELSKASKEYSEIDKEVKETFKEIGVGEYVVGKFLGTVTEINVKRRKVLTYEEETKKEVRIKILRVKD